jgi:hypothetical protein
MSETHASFDPEALVAQIERQTAEAQERAVRAQEFARDVGSLRGDAESPRRDIRVGVDVSGRLLSLDLTDDAMRLGADELSSLILQTAGVAHRRASRAALERTEEEYGAGSGVAEQLRGELETRVGSLDDPDEPEDDAPGIRW